MKTTLLNFVLSVLTLGLFAQGGVAINNNGTTAHESAILDVSSTTKGFLAPKMTTAQKTAILSPVAGLLVYDTDLEGYYMYRESIPPYTGWREIFTDDFVGIGNLNDGLYDGWNIMLGVWAGRDIVGTTNARENVGLGIEALTSMEYGKSNAALGTDALYNLNGTDANTGNFNTAVGRNTLLNITTGNNNTAIGYNAGPGSAGGTLNNTISIGANAKPSVDNQIVIGTTAGTLITLPGLPGAAAAETGDQAVYVNSNGGLVLGPALAAPAGNDTKELRSDIETLKSENAKLKAEVAELREMIEQLKKN